MRITKDDLSVALRFGMAAAASPRHAAAARAIVARHEHDELLRELERIFRVLEDSIDKIGDAVNANDGSSIVDEDLPTPALPDLGRLFHKRIPAADDELYWCHEDAGGTPVLLKIAPVTGAGATILKGEVTLAVSPATSTTIVDGAILGTSRVLLFPKTANAAAAVLGVYATVAAGTVTIQHTASALTDRTFHYAIAI